MTEKSVTNLGPSGAKLLLLSLGVGFVVYVLPSVFPSTMLTDTLSALLPGIVAAALWIRTSKTKPEDAGLLAGFLAGLGAMPAKMLFPPSVEWFGIVDLLPEAYKLIFSILPMPFVAGLMGYLYGRIVQRIRAGSATN